MHAVLSSIATSRPLQNRQGPGGGALVVNEGEAEQVRSIFKLFEQHRSALGTLAEIERREWRLKSWTRKRATSDRAVRLTRTRSGGC